MKYYYLCTQLPMLVQSGKPAITPEKFEALAKELLSKSDYELFKTFELMPERDCGKVHTGTVYDEYVRWETALRVAVAGARRPFGHPDLDGLPEPEKSYSEINHTVAAAVSLTPEAREDALNRLRLAKLDELNLTGSFSLNQICVYKLKLAIISRLSRRSAEVGRREFDRIVQAVDEKCGSPA